MKQPSATAWHRFTRGLRTLRERAQRERAALALLALLTIGLGEPLACIIHCDFWLPFVQTSATSDDPHAHHHHHTQAATASAAPVAPGTDTLTTSESSTPLLCAPMLGGDGGNVPFHVPPSPVHESLPVVLLLLISVCVFGTFRAMRPRDPPNVFLPPPFRPPTLNVV